jgi:hemoglobin
MTMAGGCCCGGRGTEGSDITSSLFERVGGQAWFVRLVDDFYDAVEDDPVLRPLYPANLVGSRNRLAMFLARYFGGPAAYSAARGHPRLRMRHFRFTIGPPERDAWLRLMTEAVQAGSLTRSDEDEVLGYFASTAAMLMNVGDRACMQPHAATQPTVSHSRPS